MRRLSFSLIKRIAYIYLTIPIIIFGLGWLNIFAAIIFCLIVTAGLVSRWERENSTDIFLIGKREGVFVLLILLFWVLLSGIGGYFFQNWDHHSRNAVFRDLINYAWPVVYHLESNVAAQSITMHDVILSYYFGFWLPAALVGKLAGWSAGNLALFFWSLTGIMLAALLTSFRLKLSVLKTTLLLIFFSGMDIIGVLLLQNVPGYTYPGTWPPIQHLEWWAGSLQYSSFTSALFWTYNQFIPALVVMSLFINSQDISNVFFLFGLCFFFAPLPAVGLLPFVIGKMISGIVSIWQQEPKNPLILPWKYVFTRENFAGLCIGGLSLIFFSTNLSAQSKGLGATVPFALYILFLLLEGMLIWFLLVPTYFKDWSWYLVGAILTFAPLIRLGASWDFMMRTTFPSLFLLFVGSGTYLAKIKGFSIRAALLLSFLILGSVTPIYELNRSIVRTDRYYGYHVIPRSSIEPYFQHPPVTNQIFVPEFDHLNTLTADDWITVAIPNSVGWKTKVGTLFSPWLALIWDPRLVQQ